MDRAALIAQLLVDEGVRLKPYKDTKGKLTIGVGRNLEDVGISEAEARALLEGDVARTETTLDHLLPSWRDLAPARQLVIASMAFNMGASKLLEFRNMLRALAAGDFDTAADEMLNSAWAHQVGNRAQRLAQAMRTG